MVPQELLERVGRQATEHCAARGYIAGPNWNPLEPQDSVAAFAMARSLLASNAFDRIIAVAPEGHVYGYFFECLGAAIGSVFVDYPPREVTEASDLASAAGKRVLLIEDDVVSGVSLGLVVAALATFRPASIALYLGRREDGQFPENVPSEIGGVFLAETHLDPADRPGHEEEFVRFFQEESLLR